MSSTGMGTGSFGLRKELSSLAAIRNTMDTALTASVGRWVCGSKEQTSFRVWKWRKEKQEVIKALSKTPMLSCTHLMVLSFYVILKYKATLSAYSPSYIVHLYWNKYQDNQRHLYFSIKVALLLVLETLLWPHVLLVYTFDWSLPVIYPISTTSCFRPEIH